jgi:mono/diheme cytochrome c family protein
MPALGSVLKDKEIADVLTYVRNSFGNKASAVTVAEVKKVRGKDK